MRSSGNNPMTSIIHIDEFVIGGREKDKVVEFIIQIKSGYHCG